MIHKRSWRWELFKIYDKFQDVEPIGRQNGGTGAAEVIAVAAFDPSVFLGDELTEVLKAILFHIQLF